MSDAGRPDQVTRGRHLLELHTQPEVLVLINVWDVASARAMAALPGTRAIATASASLSAAHGYDDGEGMPLDLVLAATSRIVDAVDLPVTADLEAGFDEPVATIRRAIEIGVVGANLEDELRPVAEAARTVEAVVAEAERLGVPFTLNARTDAYLRGGDRPAEVNLADAIERGRAYLDAGATCVFVPGRIDLPTITTLVDELGHLKVSTMGFPGVPSPAEQEAVGVTRVSFGPFPQLLVLDALAAAATRAYEGQTLTG